MTALCLALVSGALPAVRAADSFYLDLLRQGANDHAARDFGPAAKKLRTACFGFLDEPTLLAEGLVRLSLAQMGLGDREGVGQSFGRLVEIETRFGAYSAMDDPLELRREFEREIPAWVSEAALARVPVFADLPARSKKAAFDALPPTRRRKELARRVSQDPNDDDALIALTELDASEGRTRQARRRLDKILARDPGHRGALCARGRLALSLSDCESALADLPACAQPPSEDGLRDRYRECSAETNGDTAVENAPGENATGEGATGEGATDEDATGEDEKVADLPSGVEAPRETTLEPTRVEAGPPAAESPADATPPTRKAEPETASVGPSPSSEESLDLEEPAEVVRAWARAWSEKRIDDYLAFYSKDFVPSRGRSRQEWVEQRRQNLAQPQDIRVTLTNVSIRADGDRRSVTFGQSYESELLTYRVNKILDLRWETDRWKIIRESPNP